MNCKTLVVFLLFLNRIMSCSGWMWCLLNLFLSQKPSEWLTFGKKKVNSVWNSFFLLKMIKHGEVSENERVSLKHLMMLDGLWHIGKGGPIHLESTRTGIKEWWFMKTGTVFTDTKHKVFQHKKKQETVIKEWKHRNPLSLTWECPVCILDSSVHLTVSSLLNPSGHCNSNPDISD